MATQDEVRAALAASIPGYTPTDADVAYWTNQGGVGAVQNTFGGTPAYSGMTAESMEPYKQYFSSAPALQGERVGLDQLSPAERELYNRQMAALGPAAKNSIDYDPNSISGRGLQAIRDQLGRGAITDQIRADYNLDPYNLLPGRTAAQAPVIGANGQMSIGGQYQTLASLGGTGYNGGGVGGASPGATPGTGGASAGGASSGSGLVQGVNVNQYQQNPYLSQMGDVLTNRVSDNLQRQIMPGIRSNAVAAGGFGGSRQGVVEANAMKDANQTISDALTGAYFQDFTNQMNRNLAQYGQNQNFFSNQRGQDLQQLALGANLFQQGNQGWLSQGQGMLGLGQTQQQAPWQVINNANAGLGQWSGYGTTTSANQGGGAQGALGGAMAGGQLGKLWGGAGLNSNGSAYQTGAGTMSDLKSLGVF